MSQTNNPAAIAARVKAAKAKRKFAPIWLEGTLTVMQRIGKNGVFNVAKLECGLGEFAVNDTTLEQYEAGSYTGSFLVGLIAAKSRMWKSNVFIETRAYLDEFIINEHSDQLGENTRSLEEAPDPLDEEKAAQPKPAKPTPSPKADLPEAPPASEHELLEELEFVQQLSVQYDLDLLHGVDHDCGDQIAAIIDRRPVALDAKALDRETTRKQRDHLKSLGYRFEIDGAYWTAEAKAN